MGIDRLIMFVYLLVIRTYTLMYTNKAMHLLSKKSTLKFLLSIAHSFFWKVFILYVYIFIIKSP